MTMINGYDVTMAPVMTDGHSWFFVKNPKGEEKAFLYEDIGPYLDAQQPGMAWYKGHPWDDDMTENMFDELAILWLKEAHDREGTHNQSVVFSIHEGAQLLPEVPEGAVVIYDEPGGTE